MAIDMKLEILKSLKIPTILKISDSSNAECKREKKGKVLDMKSLQKELRVGMIQMFRIRNARGKFGNKTSLLRDVWSKVT